MIELLTQADFLPLAFGFGMVAAAVTILFALVGSLTGEQKRLRRRLSRVGTVALSTRTGGNSLSLRRETVDSSIASLDMLIKRFMPHPAKLRDRLASTGRKISLGQYLFACLVVGVLSFAGQIMAGVVPLAAALFALGTALALPHKVVSFMIKRRLNRFLNLFPEAIDLIVRGLRSGLPITESIKVVGAEMPNPVGIEFRRIIESFSVGMTLDEALWAAAKRLDISEFRFFVITLSVQQETGGNLTETLENLGDILRRRRQMKLKIRALSGEARASAMILGALPFIMFGALMLMHPEYVSVLMSTQLGHMMLGAALTSMSIGIAIMVRMTRFEI